MRLTPFDTTAVIGQDLDFEKIEPLFPAKVAGTLSCSAEREELIHLMVAIEILCHSIPERLERSVLKWATALHVHERSLLYAWELARGELTKAVHDFYRLNWIGDLDQRSPEFGLRWMKLGDFQEQNTFGQLLRVVWLGALAGSLLA